MGVIKKNIEILDISITLGISCYGIYVKSPKRTNFTHFKLPIALNFNFNGGQCYNKILKFWLFQ